MDRGRSRVRKTSNEPPVVRQPRKQAPRSTGGRVHPLSQRMSKREETSSPHLPYWSSQRIEVETERSPHRHRRAQTSCTPPARGPFKRVLYNPGRQPIFFTITTMYPRCTLHSARLQSKVKLEGKNDPLQARSEATQTGFHLHHQEHVGRQAPS